MNSLKQWYKLPSGSIYKIIDGKPFIGGDANIGKVCIILERDEQSLTIQKCNSMFLFKEDFGICTVSPNSFKCLAPIGEEYLLAKQELHKEDAVNFLNSSKSKYLRNIIQP